jgi:outer membrane murein-binding lipoprotein Lpp
MANTFKVKKILGASGVFSSSVEAPNLVYNTGNQAISGIKNFTSRPTINGTGVLLSGEAATPQNLATTGSTLNTKIDNLSGYSNNTFATITNLASTGSTLNTRINSLSGTLTSTYATITNLAATGSANLARINSLSGISLLKDRNQTHSGDLNVTGHFSAASKSFLIQHPVDFSKKLQYGSLESPYHGVRLTDKNKIAFDFVRIDLPNYISSLVHEGGVNVQLTNINHSKVLFVKEVNVSKNYFEVGLKRSKNDKNEYEFYWSFTAERKDIPKLTVEF